MSQLGLKPDLDNGQRIHKSGSTIVFTVSRPAFEDGGFKAHMAAIDAKGLWEALETTPSFRAIPGSKTEGDLEARFFVYRVR